MNHPFIFRAGTIDEDIFHNVNIYNEYRLPDIFQPDDIIIDIGTHIGSFCYAALQRGSNNVYGFEAEPGNYECAVRNLHSFGARVHIQNRAVWRSDQVGDKLYFHGSADDSNTSGGNVMWATEGLEVVAIPFDEVIYEVTDGGKKRVQMVKMDCEASEFPILYTSQMLHLIDHIHGEFHEIGGPYGAGVIPERAGIPGFDRFTIEDLAAILDRAGFDVEWWRHQSDSHMGLFFASRRLTRIELRDGEAYLPFEPNPTPGDRLFAVDIYAAESNKHPEAHLGWWIWPADQGREAEGVHIAYHAPAAAEAWLVRGDDEVAAQSQWLNPDYQLRPLQQISLIWKDVQDTSRIQSQALLAVGDAQLLNNRLMGAAPRQTPNGSSWRDLLNRIIRRK